MLYVSLKSSLSKCSGFTVINKYNLLFFKCQCEVRLWKHLCRAVGLQAYNSCETTAQSLISTLVIVFIQFVLKMRNYSFCLKNWLRGKYGRGGMSHGNMVYNYLSVTFSFLPVIFMQNHFVQHSIMQEYNPCLKVSCTSIS
jgi:hypothetical protein